MSKKIVQLNEEVIKGELKELVRSSVEEGCYMMAGSRWQSPHSPFRRYFH